MRLTADQELRRDLLHFSFSKQPDVEAAIEMAALMERFILNGREECNAKNDGVSGAGTANGQDYLPANESSAEQASSRPGTSASGDEAPGKEDIKATKRRWSAADDQEFTRLWQTDCDLEEIADELDRTVPSLYCRARALGLPKRNPKPKAEPGTQAPVCADAKKHESAAAPVQACSKAQADQARPEKRNGGSGTAGRQVIKQERYRSSASGSADQTNGLRRSFYGSGKDSGVSKPSGRTLNGEQVETFIDPIIQFLRSRDYSVVRVGEGKYRLDGRHTLSTDELREKANQVRKSLGQPPFVFLSGAAAS